MIARLMGGIQMLQNLGAKHSGQSGEKIQSSSLGTKEGIGLSVFGSFDNLQAGQGLHRRSENNIALLNLLERIAAESSDQTRH
jgi:hypothetical protein